MRTIVKWVAIGIGVAVVVAFLLFAFAVVAMYCCVPLE